MENQKEYYDNFFKTHGPDVHLDPVRFSSISALARGSVLDCGCGTGNLADFYAGDYWGVDISDVAIEHAKNSRRKTANFCAKSIERFFAEGDKSYDTIVFAEFLEHVKNDDWLGLVISSKLKPNGRIIVSVPNGDRVPDESHLRTFTVPELRKKFSQFGRVRFHNWPGFANRILMTCDVGEKNPDLLTLTMMVKNEGVGLENAILSCIDFVDQIVINIDEASSDDTLKIAKLYADDCNVFQWKDSFSHARNLVQSRVKTPWVLSLDGHEQVVSVGPLAKALESDYDSFSVKIKLENKFSFYFPRIIRKEIKWINDVHNSPKCEKPCHLRGFEIEHHRSDMQAKDSAANRDKQRDEMVQKYFNGLLKKNRKDCKAWFYLGQHFNYIGKVRRAISCYKKYLRYSQKKEERWLVCFELASLHMQAGRTFRALLALNAADKEIPGRWEIKFSRGVLYGLNGQTDLSLNYFVASLDREKEIHVYNPLPYDEASTFDLIGAGLYGKGNNDEAKIAWRRCLEVESAKDEKKQNKNKIEIWKRMTA
jgi:SAM-dependent methyltransferase/tetratricopeptide (TPR) repeat protein